MDVDGLLRIQLADVLAQFVHRDADKAVDAAVCALRGGAHVEKCYTAVARQGGNLVPVEGLDLAGQHVLNRVARVVDRILCGAERRRVAQLQLGQIGRCKTGADRHGEYIAALVHAVVADELRAEQAARAFLIDHLH